MEKCDPNSKPDFPFEVSLEIRKVALAAAAQLYHGCGDSEDKDNEYLVRSAARIYEKYLKEG